MKAITHTILFGKCKSMLNYIETEMNQMNNLIVLRQCNTKAELNFCLTQHKINVVVVGLVSNDLFRYCVELKSRFKELKFLFISNDFETAHKSLTFLEDRIYESRYNASVRDLADEISVIHHQDWLTEFSTVYS